MECNSPSTECVKIGNKTASVFTTEQNLGGAYVKSKTYTVVLSPAKTFQITYKATSAQDYDSNLAKFEDTLKSIKFTK
jgi:hypothetical protein